MCVCRCVWICTLALSFDYHTIHNVPFHYWFTLLASISIAWPLSRVLKTVPGTSGVSGEWVQREKESCSFRQIVFLTH